jgi:hypothetical protein
MVALLCFFLTSLASQFKSRSRLEAENAALRHQLIVLQRKVRGKVPSSSTLRSPNHKNRSHRPPEAVGGMRFQPREQSVIRAADADDTITIMQKIYTYLFGEVHLSSSTALPTKDARPRTKLLGLAAKTYRRLEEHPSRDGRPDQARPQRR